MGYAAEAARALVAYARDFLGAEKVYSNHCEPNKASGKVLLKCGMKFIGYGEFQKLDGSCRMRSMEYEIEF